MYPLPSTANKDARWKTSPKERIERGAQRKRRKEKREEWEKEKRRNGREKASTSGFKRANR